MSQLLGSIGSFFSGPTGKGLETLAGLGAAGSGLYSNISADQQRQQALNMAKANANLSPQALAAMVSKATVPLNSQLVQAVTGATTANLAEQGLSWGPPFPPGRPLDPFWGNRRPPRTWDFAVGENVQLTPRWNRVSFQTLKALYDKYDVAQICVRHLLDDVRSLDVSWLPPKNCKDDVSEDLEAAERAKQETDRW